MPIVLDPSSSSIVVTAGDIILAAAKKLGVVSQGEPLGAEEYNDGLAALNSMVEAFAIDKLLLHHIAQLQFTWAGNSRTRTIGAGGDFDANWPIRIEPGTFFRDSSNNDFPVAVTHDEAVYERFCFKTAVGAWPNILYYDRAFPLGTLKAYPYPSTAMTLFLSCWQPLQSFPSITTQLSLPPGYRRMIEHNLAVECESIFGMPCPASVVKIAAESKADVRRMNARPMLASLAEATLMSSGSRRTSNTGFNILTG
jgi:hypothetical protein